MAEAGRSVNGLGAVTIATNMAGRGTDIKLTQEVKEAGGLAIIGTERQKVVVSTASYVVAQDAKVTQDLPYSMCH